MLEKDSMEEVVAIVGEFKPKKKFLSFISTGRGSRVRLNREVAFIKGEKLSGILNGSVFKITIHAETGTIDFEESKNTNLSDSAMRQRLLDDIEARLVVGYTNKYVISGLDFEDEEGNLCYLEVDETKPFDRLRGLFEDDEVAPVEVSKRGLDFLSDLLGEDEDEEPGDVLEAEAAIEEVVETIEVVVEKPALSFLEQQFKDMNDAKVLELTSRINDSKADIAKYEREIKFAEGNRDKVMKSMGVLETRLETLTPGDEPNGYVFFVSDKQDNGIELNDETKVVATKIAKLMNLKVDVLLENLTEGFFKIKIATKDTYSVENIDQEIYAKIANIGLRGEFSVVADGELQYTGDLNWHQLVSKMLRNGFEQDAEFEKNAGSNSYKSKEDEEAELLAQQTLTLSAGNGGFVLQGTGGILNANNVVQVGAPTPVATSEVKADLTDIKSVEVMTFDVETDLVVVGSSYADNDGNDFSLTDDYSAFEVIVGNKEHKGYYESDGFVSIMTLEQFKEFQDRIIEDCGELENNGCDSFFLPKFKGTIGVTAKLDEKVFTDEFDITDYITHQFDNDKVDRVDVFMTLPEGTVIVEMTDHTIPLAKIRDMKIESVLSNNVDTKTFKFDMNDEDVVEGLEEFKDENNYPIGNVFIFTLMEDPDGDFGFMSMITPKSYYDREGFTYDQHLDYLLKLPSHFEELAESIFASQKSDVECIDELINLGFKFNEAYHLDLESNHGNPTYTINGVTLFDYIKAKYPQAIV